MSSACVYRLFDADDVLLYIGHTTHFPRRLELHLNGTTSRIPGADELRERYHHHTLEHFDWLFDATRAEREAIRDEAPVLNRVYNVKRFHKPDRRGPYVALPATP